MADLKTLLGEPANKPTQSIDVKSILGEPENKPNPINTISQTQESNPVDEQGLKDYFGKTITSKTPTQSISEGMSKIKVPIEKRLGKYLTDKVAENTGGAKLPNPLSPSQSGYRRDMEEYISDIDNNPNAQQTLLFGNVINGLIQKTKEADKIIKDYESKSTIGNLSTGIKAGLS